MTAAIAMSFMGGEAMAKQCRDQAGKFIACPAAASAPTKCRNITTKKFAKCGTPGTEAVPMKKAPR
jgi:hypothetical protein